MELINKVVKNTGIKVKTIKLRNYFKVPIEDPKVTIRGEAYRKVILPDNTFKLVKRKGHGQASPIEIKRCLTALKGREDTIAEREERLRKARNSKDIEKWKEGVEAAIIWRDWTQKRLDQLLSFSSEHTYKCSHPAAKEAVPLVKHLIAVKDDYDLILQVRSGGSRKHNAFKQLQTKYNWLITNFSRPGGAPIPSDEAVSEGLKGLWDAALKFDPLRKKSDRGYASFSTVAYSWVFRNTRIRNRKDTCPGQILDKKELKTTVPLAGGSSDDESLGFLAGKESTISQDQLKMDMATALNKLENKHQLILHMQYFDSLNVQEISRQLSIPPHIVKKLSDEAHIELKGKLNGYCLDN